MLYTSFDTHPHLKYYKYKNITAKFAGLASGNTVTDGSTVPLLPGKADVGVKTQTFEGPIRKTKAEHFEGHRP